MISILSTINTGCVQQKTLEKLGLITISGYDLVKENKIKGTVVVQKFDPMTKTESRVITAFAKTSKGLRQQENLQSNQRLVSGQLRTVIYSRELAEKGISQLVDTLNRDAAIGNMVYITIADKSASEILKKGQNKPNINLGTYVYNLIQQNVEGEQIISPTLHEFNHNLYEVGKDPVLPILKIKNKKVIISGVGLFKNDRLVDEIKGGGLFYLKILINSSRAGAREIGINKKQLQKLMMKNQTFSDSSIYNKVFLIIDNIRSKTKIKLVDKKNLHFKVTINLDSRLLEMTEALDLSTPESMRYLEKTLNKVMKKDVEDLLVHFKELGIDPIGFGNEYEAHVRGKPESMPEWREKYKHATFDVHVKNTIERTGVID
jgi:spore germination protein